ncbi:MAG TPA: hypothetical protein VIU46_01690, partial [Gallionellaceae bacterium]
IEALLGVVDKLRKIASVDTGDIHQGLDLLLQEAEWDWLRSGGDKLPPDADRHSEGRSHDGQQTGGEAQRQDKGARRQPHVQDN